MKTSKVKKVEMKISMRNMIRYKQTEQWQKSNDRRSF